MSAGAPEGEEASLGSVEAMSAISGSMLQIGDFEKTVSIDVSKLNEYLYKLEGRVHTAEKELYRMVEEQTHKAKENKDNIAKEIDAMNEEDEDKEQEEDPDSTEAKSRRFLEEWDGSTGEKIDVLRQAVMEMGNTINKMEIDNKQRAQLQSAKDAAQDEILEMELKRLERQIDAKLSKTELIEMNKLQDQKLKNLEAVLIGIVDSRTHDVHLKLALELDKVLDQLNHIQQATDASNKIMEDRIKQAVARGLERKDFDAKKERKLQDEMAAEMDTLNTRIAELEQQHTELLEALGSAKANIEALANHVSVPTLPPPPAIDVDQLTADLLNLANARIMEAEERIRERVVTEMTDVRTELLGLEGRIKEEAEGQGTDIQAEVERARNDTLDSLEELRMELRRAQEEAVRDNDDALERLREELEALKQTPPIQPHPVDVHPSPTLKAEMLAALEKQVADTNRELMSRMDALTERMRTTEEQAVITYKRQGDQMQTLHEEVLAKVDERKRETDAMVAIKLREMEHCIDTACAELKVQMQRSTDEVISRVEAGVSDGESKRAALDHAIMELRKSTKLMGVKSIKSAAAQALGEDPPFQDIITCMDAQRAEDDYQIARLERSAIGLAELYRQLQGIVRGLASRDNHWAVMEARLYEHCEGMAMQCLGVMSEATSAKLFSLPSDTKDYIATNAYRIAKVLAYKVDYETIRRIVGAREVAADEDWDATVIGLRSTYLTKFLNDILTRVHHQYPAHDPAVVEARTRFCDKVERAVKLALSKFGRMQIAATLFGRVKLEATHTCVACNRPLMNDTMPGDKRAACLDPLPWGHKVEKPSTAQSRVRDPAIPDDPRPFCQQHSMASIGHRIPGTCKPRKPVYRGGFRFPRVPGASAASASMAGLLNMDANFDLLSAGPDGMTAPENDALNGPQRGSDPYEVAGESYSFSSRKGRPSHLSSLTGNQVSSPTSESSLEGQEAVEVS